MKIVQKVEENAAAAAAFAVQGGDEDEDAEDMGQRTEDTGQRTKDKGIGSRTKAPLTSPRNTRLGV